MSFAGLRGTGDWATDERPKNFREMILRLNPNGNAPMFALLARVAKQSTDDPEFAWWEMEQFIPRLRMSAGLSVATASTAVEFDSIDGTNSTKGNALDLRPGDLLMAEEEPGGSAPSNEIMRVSSVTDNGNIVVERAYSGTSAKGQAASTYLYRIGNAFSEGSGSPNTSSRNPTKVFNYTQIFKTAWELTGTAQQTRTRTGDPQRNEEILKAFEHSASIEQAFLWGERSETTSTGNSKPLRTTKGIYRFLSSNITTWDNTSFTTSNMTEFFGQIFNNTADGINNERLVFAGNAWINKFNTVVATDSSTRFTFNGVLNLFGMNLMRYVTPHGTIAIRSHPLFTQNPHYSRSALIYAPGAIKYRNMLNRDTKVMRNVQLPDEDTRKDMWLSECGIELQHESLHGWSYFSNP